ncbi:MAG: MFS transporter, partial [Xanthobacteraceae bacterium]
MTRQIAPDDAHSIAPDIGGDVRARGRGEARPAAKAEEPDRPPQHHAPTAPLDHATIRAIVAGIMLAMFLSALEQTIVAPALPAIGKSLGGIDDRSWIVTAYLLAATAATPLFGKLSDIY